MRVITVADGYTGRTVELDADDVLDTLPNGIVKLHVVGKPWLIRWVYPEDCEPDCQEPPHEGPDTRFLFK